MIYIVRSVDGRLEQVILKLPVFHEEMKIDLRPTYHGLILTSIAQDYNAAIWCDKNEPYGIIDC